MNKEQRAVLDYLNENDQGTDNIRTSDEIQQALNLPTGGRTNEYTRDIIRDLIINHNALIGSDSRGYWIIQSEDELHSVIESLNSRACYCIAKKLEK